MRGGVERRHRVDVWLLATAPHASACVSPYLELLSEVERDTAQRILLADEQHLYIRSRALLRTLLSARTGVPPEQWRFDCNAFGRPFVEASSAYRDLHFNVSHTKNLTACAISTLPGLGIDVENVAHERDFLAMARGFFAPREFDYLAATSLQKLGRRFYAYWTLKEAYVKGKGMGLSLALSSISFDLSGAPRIAFDAEAESEKHGWRFLSTPISDDAMLALAVNVDAHNDVEVAIHRLAPEFLSGLNVETCDVCMLPAFGDARDWR